MAENAAREKTRTRISRVNSRKVTGMITTQRAEWWVEKRMELWYRNNRTIKTGAYIS
jgi:hypothetical protein